MLETKGGVLRQAETGRIRSEHPLAVNKKDGSVMAHVPPGPFQMGDDWDEDTPRRKVHCWAYWIGVFCVTNAQYLRFVEETGHRPPDKATQGRPIWHGRFFPSVYADHPVVCVSCSDAEAYAQWAGCASPTEAQREKAARGPSEEGFPWG